MRIVVDLQAAQSPGSRVRGIGRYSLSLVEAMARQAGDHEVWVALNHGIEDVVDELRARLARVIPEDRLAVWESISNVAGHDVALAGRRHCAELLRQEFIDGLVPDVVHTASLFEGWSDDAVTSISRREAARALSAVTHYDLIPYVRQATYLGDERYRRWYTGKLHQLSNADLLLAISEFSRTEAIDCLGVDPERIVNISAACDTVFRRLSSAEIERASPALRRRHGLPGRYVIYTGGFDARKNIDGLIRAFASLDSTIRAGLKLVIVGHGPEAEIRRLRGIALQCGLDAGSVVFTGFVSDEDLCALYNLCDLYVFPSFHEGFGLPALEAMACGAVVIGADGSSLPEVIGLAEALFDPASTESIARLMERCLLDDTLREHLREHAARQVERFSWDASAQRAIHAMERAHARRSTRSVPVGEGVQKPIASTMVDFIADDAGYASLCKPLARALALNERPSPPRRRLLVDVTMLADVDVGTGIQRVVRNILRQLLRMSGPDLEVEPVRFMAGVGYLHARAFLSRFQGQEPGQEDSPVDAGPGDTLLGLDLIAHLLPDDREYFRWLRDRGVKLWFVVYDLLPVTRPECFPPGGLGVFQRWYMTVGELATGAVCISRAVAGELKDWYDQVQPRRLRPLAIGHFHLGADLGDDVARLDVHASIRPREPATFLMVGTIEPRKGHAQVLDAFELLWSRGVEARLVIIGKPGWLVEELTGRLRESHADGRLQWLEAASDSELVAQYASASALIMASEAEGFGLPLIEAAQHQLPMIARDLPVFREVAGNGAFYFDGTAPAALADAVQQWLALSAQGQVPDPDQVSWITWADSARQLLDVVLSGAQDEWLPEATFRVTAAHPGVASQNGSLLRGRMVPDGRPGYLIYGPYSRLPEGRYDVAVELDRRLGSGNAILDLVAFRSLDVLHRVDIAEGGGPIRLDFAIDADRDLEDFQIRLLLPDGGSIEFVSCVLTPRAEDSGTATTQDRNIGSTKR